MSEDDQGVFSAPGEVGIRHFPLIQVVESEAEVHVRAVIPGAALASICLTFSRGRLIIRGALPSPRGIPLRRERPTGPFRRDVPIPCPVVSEDVRAVIRNGVLTVVLPKEQRKARRAIPVSRCGKEGA